jgi:hypothetical protein
VEFSAADLEGAFLHGSVLEGVRGGGILRRVVIGTDQVVPLALSVFAALGIRVDDDAER